MSRPKTFKPKRKQTAEDARSAALTRLRERWENENEDEEWRPQKEPVVTPMFKAVEGGLPVVLEALRAHDEEDAKAFIDLYDSLSATDRKNVSIEAVAFSCGIGSLRLAEVVQTALYVYASMQTKMLISTAMPKVTRSIIKAATDEVPITARNPETGDNEVVGHTNGDVKAMELFGRISGIAPVPKGAQIAIQNNYGEPKEEKESAAPAWRSAEDRLKEFHDATEPKRLPSPASKPILVGGHIDAMQAETVEILRSDR